MTRALISGVVALFAVSLGGCTGSPASSFYQLKPDSTLTTMGTAVPVYVVVHPVTIPALVDRPQIVVSVADNQVWPEEFQRWAEPLKGNIQRTIAGDLAVLLGSEHVSVYGADSSGLPTWRVRVDIMQFDSVLGDWATIEALWTIWPPGKATPITGRTLAHQPVKGQAYDALVAAHDRALGSVSRDVAAAILQSLSR
ncbi:PqiC family protein [Paraburkholderia dinghuensis]|uniref:Membrane integrity-associated transporter subunit PqiC n=1 Tax=Paraburkholderia dinghuensis TaxID=2305225 RepID=A0A3N6MRE9_9BURK|nr:PqiC family protein [Paraburkholderia dinghuensis]RQH04365.1 membrane integrity-associated transporter subunit PqiC [Paraburkholderia dinghuensis]